MKHLLIISLIVVTICGCATTKKSTITQNKSLTDELNNSIIEGFFNNDTTGLGKSIYFVK